VSKKTPDLYTGVQVTGSGGGRECTEEYNKKTIREK